MKFKLSARAVVEEPLEFIPYVRTSGGNTVYVLTVDPGQDPFQISTTTANVVLSPIVSPSGLQVIWKMAGNLWIANTDGTGETLLHDPGSTAVTGFSWAVDSSHILLTVGTAEDETQVWSIEPDGSNLGVVYTQPTGKQITHPSYNHDGTLVAFLVDIGGFPDSVALWTANADFTGAAQIASWTGATAEGDIQNYSWANTQNKLAYKSTAGNLQTINSDGSGSTNCGDVLDVLRDNWSVDDSEIFEFDGSDVFLEDLKTYSPSGGGSSIIWNTASSHGRLAFAKFGRVYLSGDDGPNVFVKSILEDGSDVRTEFTSTSGSTSMF